MAVTGGGRRPSAHPVLNVYRASLNLALLALFVAADVPAMAQYGQYPPGQYAGQYPGQSGQSGPGLPFPRRNKKKKDAAAEEANLQQIKGMFRQLEDKSIVITADDSRNIQFERTEATKFLNKGEAMKADLLRPGDHVMVEASQDDNGYFHAVRVNFEKEGTMDDRQKASQPVQVSVKTPPAGGSRSGDDDDRPVIRRKDSTAATPSDTPPPPPAAAATAQEAKPVEPPEPPERANVPVVESNVPIDESDPGAPTLRRGGPAKPRRSIPDQPVAMNVPPVAPGRENAPVASGTRPAPAVVENEPKLDPRIEKARQAVAVFTESLPSYVCQEQIARFQSTTHKADWQPIDIVSAEVVYENHREQYRNLAINGKPAKKRMEDLSGSWSTGEFGTVLVDLFNPSTAADFRYRRQVKSAGRDAYLFDFEVERENSHWHVEVASQSVLPAYRGSVWIDKETSQSLRIEMEAIQMPAGFPFDKIESATDYQFIRIGEHQFLLPVHSEVLSCQRGTNNCSRNSIDFRNYHRYSGESTITFEPK